MNLQNVFDQLRYGELTNLSIAGSKDGGVQCENKLKLAASVELGLTALYRRFRLKQQQTIITLEEGKDTYVITQSDVLKVERIYSTVNENNEPDRRELMLDLHNVPESITTLNNNTLLVPDSLKRQDLIVVYRANHPALDKAKVEFDPSKVDIELPETHLEALLYFVASRVFNPIGLTDEFHDGNNFMAKYEAACLLLEAHNYQSDNQADNERFCNAGWV